MQNRLNDWNIVDNIFTMVISLLLASAGWCVYLGNNSIPTPGYLEELIAECEINLPRTQRCEIQITAVVVETE
jgi:hypothetical protein